MVSGIYIITNMVNGHIYIGSSINCKKRWYRHVSELRKNKHHSLYLQRAWNKYGENSFKFYHMIKCNKDHLFNMEIKSISLLLPEYNIGSVCGGDNISKHPNIEAIKQKHSENGKKRLSNLEERKKMSQRQLGNNNSNWRGGKTYFKCPLCNNEIRVAGKTNQKTCSKCRDITGKKNPFYGKKHTDKVKQKMRNGRVGKKPTNCNKIEINGIIYNSQSDAAKALCISPATITYRIKNGLI